MNPDGMVALLNYRVSVRIQTEQLYLIIVLLQEDGVTRKSNALRPLRMMRWFWYIAYLTFWKDGLKIVKL